MSGFDLVERRTAFLFPGSLDRVPAALAYVECVFERILPLGGSIVFVVRAL